MCKTSKVDFEQASAELMRAVRGGRSQEAFARRLGCRANAIYTWESGRNFPTAARALRAAERAGIDVRAALARFYVRPPTWLSEADPTQPTTIARLLDDLRGSTSILALAEATGRSRFAVSRWLKGQTEPRLPDFLRLIEASSLRLLDFIACLVDPGAMPCVRSQYRALEATRRTAYEVPLSQAFLRALELSAYGALPRHEAGWLATELGLPREEEERCLQLLLDSGQVRFDGRRYVLDRVMAVDTRRDPEAARRLRLFWMRMGAERLAQQRVRRHGRAQESQSAAAYNVFGVSLADLARLRELQRAHFRQMRAIIAQSQPVEAVVLANLQLLQLNGTDLE